MYRVLYLRWYVPFDKCHDFSTMSAFDFNDAFNQYAFTQQFATFTPVLIFYILEH